MVGNLSKSILNKTVKSVYEKDKVFVNLHNQLEDKNFYQKIICLLSHHLLIKKVMLIIQHSIVLVNLLNYCMLTLQIQFFLAKFAVDPKYCLLLVDLFTSKIYVYPKKNRSLLAKKLIEKGQEECVFK